MKLLLYFVYLFTFFVKQIYFSLTQIVGRKPTRANRLSSSLPLFIIIQLW